MRIFRAAVVGAAASVLLTLFLLATAYARANEPEPLPFDIGPQSLGAALDAFARQSHEELLFAPGVVAKKSSPGVRGMMAPQAALRILLKDSGLSFSTTPSGALLVGAPGSANIAGQRAPTVSKPLDRQTRSSLQLAQAAPGASTGATSAISSSGERAPDSGSTLEEVVVSAQKREERLIDVPISIVAMTDAELEKRKINTIDDLTFAVPGLSINSNGAQRYIFLRGISNPAGGSLPLIGMYLDEADVTSGPYSQLDLGTYDLKRVEVLRGPQGTLYGEGSAGGTIHFVTKDPVLDGFVMDGAASAMFTERGAPSQRIEEVLNVPLFDNYLGLRIASTFDHEGGWIDQPAADRTNWNDEDRTDVRIKGLWRPITQLTVSAMSVIHRNDLGFNIGEDTNGNFAQVFNLTTTPQERDDYDIDNLTVTYDLGSVRFVNSTSYFDQDEVYKNFGFIYPITPPGTTAFDDLQSPVYIKAYVTTEEFRLASTGTGPWQWTIGGHYRNYRYDLSNTFAFGLPGPPGTALPATSLLHSIFSSQSHSFFGDTSYQLTRRLTVGAGVRGFHDDQGRLNLGTTVTDQRGTFRSIDPRYYARYKLSDAANVYASAAKGFRSGGFNALNQPLFGPENVWTYEVGTKMSLFGGRLSADTALFYSEYKGYQISGKAPPPAPPVNIYRNAGNARIKGVEWDLTWIPLGQWALSVNGNYLISQFTEILITPATSAYAVGDPLDYAPNHTVTFSVQRDFQWIGRPSFVRLDYNQQGRETLRNRSIGPWFYSTSDVINMLNLNTGLQWSQELSLGFFAQNLLNDRGRVDPNGVYNYAARARPRTYGVQFSVKFQ